MRGRRSAKPKSDQDKLDSRFVGRQLGEIFRAEAAPSFVTRELHAAKMAVTYIRSDAPPSGRIDFIPTEDAFMITAALKDFEANIWEDGRAYQARPMKPGYCMINDLNRAQGCAIDEPLRSVHFYLPRAALNEIAEDMEAASPSELQYRPGEPYLDPTVSVLASSLLPSFEQPDHVNPMFLDYVTFALGVHVAQVFGGLRPGSRMQKGGLAKWQEKRATDVLGASIKGEAKLRDVARDCGLSVGHFSRAFKQTTGLAPHQWLMVRRVDHAKSLLNDRRMSLLEVALASGFADQSHFTRVFSRIVGSTPGMWRRDHDTGGAATDDREREI